MRDSYTFEPGSVLGPDGMGVSAHAKAKLLYHELAEIFELAAGRRTADEVAAVRQLIATRSTGARRVIDFGCGIGRHAGQLAKSGFDVTGVDQSPEMLAIARDRAPGVRFVQSDFQTVRVERDFDVAMIMWTTFNYLGCGDEVARFAETAAWHLRDSGILIVDVANYELSPRIERYSRAASDERFNVDLAITKCQYEGHNVAEYRYCVESKQTGEKRLVVDQEIARIYRAEELEHLLGPAFRLLAVHGDYDLSPLDHHRSPRLLAVYEKHG
jgi:SAM-dependent methyltransferase